MNNKPSPKKSSLSLAGILGVLKIIDPIDFQQEDSQAHHFQGTYIRGLAEEVLSFQAPNLQWIVWRENHGKSIGNHGSYHLFPLHCIRLSLYSFFRIFPWINGKPGQFTGRSAGPLRSCGKKGSATGSDNTLQPRFLLCHDIRISSHLIIWMEFRFPQIAQIAAI